MQLPHLASRLYGTPLLLARSKLDILLAVLGDRIGWPEPHAALVTPPPRFMPDAPPGIAVIPVVGTLTRRSLGLDAASGLTSYGEISAMLDAAIADPAVAGILLDVDSPGGEAGGVFELAQRIRAADAIKPVWALASDSAFSAAYAIAAAASRVYVTQTGGVGSIGVIAMHVDQSVRDTQEGYRYTAITAGDQKNDFSPHAPLDKEASARLQAEVDRLYGLFVTHVAAMRRLEPRFVRSTQAGLYFGSDAVMAGLADAEGSYEQVLADLSSTLATPRSRGVPLAVANTSLSVAVPLLLENLPMHTHEPPVVSEPTDDTATTAPAVPVSPVIPASAPPAPTSATPPTSPDDDETSGTSVADVAAAAGSARTEALAIAELCHLAGHPELTAGYLASNLSESHVRKALLAIRAESVEIASTLPPDANPPAGSFTASPHRAGSNPLLSAIHKLTGKD
jgi:signal peptide peptidase SppA